MRAGIGLYRQSAKEMAVRFPQKVKRENPFGN
ncbi:hypothetical protein L901_06625 [Agrobacterium sp. D14]|nr:hypothetical protein L901_06625 [Agrobacterium sp. D14]